jgi:DNA-directed RNA polymerase subunit RPC12/RpoP
MLARFVRLARGDDAAVIAFAERYGALRLCKHDLPASHNPGPNPVPVSGAVTWCDPTYREPVATWHLLAEQAEALLNIADAVHRGRPAADRDWATVYARSGKVAPWWTTGSVQLDRSILAQVVNEWLAIGDVRPMLRARHDSTELAMVATGGLFGALALRIAAAVAATSVVYLCDGCGKQIDMSERQRRPQAGKRAFCADCRAQGVPARFASAKYRMLRRADR